MKLERINVTVTDATAEYLRVYGKEHGMSEGEVINSLVLDANTDYAESVALSVLEYFELMTRRYAYKKFNETIIATIAFLLSYLVPKHMSPEEAQEKIKTYYDDLIRKLADVQGREH